MAAFVIFYIGVVIEFLELKGSFYLIEFAYNNYLGKLDIPLNEVNTRRFNFKMNLISNRLLNKVLYFFVLTAFSAITGASIIALLDPHSGFSLAYILFWSLLTLTWLTNLFNIFMMGVAA